MSLHPDHHATRSDIVDLSRFDLPQLDASSGGRWVLRAQLSAENGARYSVVAAFVLAGGGDEAPTGVPGTACATVWALIDPAGCRYVYESVIGRDVLDAALLALADDAVGDPFLARAVREMLDKSAVPAPNRLLAREPCVARDSLSLDFDGDRLWRDDDGRYQLVLATPDGRFACALTFAASGTAVLLSALGTSGPDLSGGLSYLLPGCDVRGTLTIDGHTLPATGLGHYERELAPDPDTSSTELDIARRPSHFVIQLDQAELLLLGDQGAHASSASRAALLVHADGRAEGLGDHSLVELAHWTSTRTFCTYPVRWRLVVPSRGLDLELAADPYAQECLTMVAPRPLWNGRVRVIGSHAGRPVEGLAFVEQSGHAVETIDDFFRAVGRETRLAIERLLPRHLGSPAADVLIGGPGVEHWKDGVDLEQYERALIQPIRDIVERGGKTWRSYVILACIDVVGGDPEAFRDWLALPELTHVGSLIIDDVQDNSEVRRGGPAAHVTHGVPLAINAGSACSFFAEIPLHRANLPPERAVRVYRRYFEAIRAAHAGQALDIDGLERLMPAVVASGDGGLLEERLIATHRLKSAAPPCALARAAAVVGGGSEAQEMGLADLLEAYGIAFQIIDDVLNLEGFEGNLKTVGEDVSEGKVTAPVAKAMSRLSLEQRRELWAAIASRPKDPAVVAEVIETLGRCGAIAACKAHASELVERAWARVEPLLPDCHAKLRLRAFGWFVLQRHY